MRTSPSLKGILCVIAALLAVNVVVMLARPGTAQPPLAYWPEPVQASGVIRQEGINYVTTNQSGDILYVWQFGRFVGDRFDSVKVHSYPASGGGPR